MHIDLLTPAELQKLRSLIVAADNIVVCCHVSPDGDALGSSLAWAEALRQFDKNPVIIVPDQFPDFLRWLPCIETVVRYDKRPDEADASLPMPTSSFVLISMSCRELTTCSRHFLQQGPRR